MSQTVHNHGNDDALAAVDGELASADSKLLPRVAPFRPVPKPPNAPAKPQGFTREDAVGEGVNVGIESLVNIIFYTSTATPVIQTYTLRASTTTGFLRPTTFPRTTVTRTVM